jgi:hypothetical protein
VIAIERKFNGLFTMRVGHIDTPIRVRVTDNNGSESVAYEYCFYSDLSAFTSWWYRSSLRFLACVSGLQNREREY